MVLFLWLLFISSQALLICSFVFCSFFFSKQRLTENLQKQKKNIWRESQRFLVQPLRRWLNLRLYFKKKSVLKFSEDTASTRSLPGSLPWASHVFLPKLLPFLWVHSLACWGPFPLKGSPSLLGFDSTSKGPICEGGEAVFLSHSPGFQGINWTL